MAVAPSTVNAPQRGRRSLRTLLAAGALVLVAAAVTLAVEHTAFPSSSSSGGLRGSGVAATQTRHVASFRRVELAGANVVVVHVGAKPALTVRGDDNLIRFVTTRVLNGRLVVAQSRSFSTKAPMSVEATVPRLDEVALSGSGVLNVDGVRGSRFSVRVPGSGVLTATGEATRLDANLSGSGDVRLQELIARDVIAGVSGSGRLQISASRSLDATLSGSGAIFYSGNPVHVSQSITGSGAILKSG